MVTPSALPSRWQSWDRWPGQRSPGCYPNQGVKRPARYERQ
jgi:hypothetical protein